MLRGFSAPVRVDYPYTREQLLALGSRDDDGFVRWGAMQQLMIHALQHAPAAQDGAIDPLLVEAVRAVIEQDGDPAIRADMLRLPSETYLAELASQDGGIDVHGIHAAREGLRKALATALRESWEGLYAQCRVTDAYEASGEQIGRRALANVALDYLATASVDGVAVARAAYEGADNLTDRLVALRTIVRQGDEADGTALLDDFYQRFGHETLALNHWLQIQAENTRGDAVARVRALMDHEAYDASNPNKIRALVGTFANLNAVNFHRADGAGYGLLGEVIEGLNERNPQIASRLLTPLTRWRNYPAGGAAMRAELERLAALPQLSRDVYEVVSKSLADDQAV